MNIGAIFIIAVAVIVGILIVMVLTATEDPYDEPEIDHGTRLEGIKALDELELWCERERSWIVKQESITTSYKNGQLVQINRMLDQINKTRRLICEGMEESYGNKA